MEASRVQTVALIGGAVCTNICILIAQIKTMVRRSRPFGGPPLPPLTPPPLANMLSVAWSDAVHPAFRERAWSSPNDGCQRREVRAREVNGTESRVINKTNKLEAYDVVLFVSSLRSED